MIIGKAITAGGSGSNIKKVPLPEGYTQLTYIQGTGTQYIDTGYVPNQSTRIMLDAHIVPTETTEPVFGARTALSSNAFALWVYGDTVNPQYGNVSYNTQSINMDYDRRLVYELNKNVFTVDGTTKTFAETTFNSTYPMYIFQINNFGSAFSRGSKGKLYSCQIYDNDILIRDFVPCINPSAEVGLYEMVNGVFYGNAGSGVFSGAPLSNVSGVSCFLTVETNEGVVVTATLGGKVVEAVADENGIAILILNKKGIWTVTATLDGMTITKEIDTSFSVEKNLSFFPAEPSSYEYMALITSSQTWTAPEDGYFQIEVFGASGKGGVSVGLGSGGNRFTYATGGGGGGGGYAASRITLNKGDTIALTVGNVGATTSAIVNSSHNNSYDHTLQVTSGANGTDGNRGNYGISWVTGTGGAGGTANGGNYSNANGAAGTDGIKVSSGVMPDGGDFASGGAGANGAPSGGASAKVDVSPSDNSKIQIGTAGKGSAGFFKIYRGNTNVVA